MGMTNTETRHVPTVPPAAASVSSTAGRSRIPLDAPGGIVGRLLTGYARRRFGQVPESLLALARNPRVLRSHVRYEMSAARWDALDPQLKALAEMAASAAIDCSWCMDFGYYMAHSQGLDMVKIASVTSWRAAAVFTDVERAVLEYTEAMTSTPPTVTDDMVAGLRTELGDAALVELTMMVAVENLRSRVNAALGLTSQGFSESCRVPLQPVADRTGPLPDAADGRGPDDAAAGGTPRNRP